MKSIIETDIMFVDEKVFGDKKEHCYDVECYDGYGLATRIDDSDTNAPQYLRVQYCMYDDVMANDDLCNDILQYRGLYDKDKSDIHFGDIMLYSGIIEKVFVCGDTIISRDDFECCACPLNADTLTDTEMQNLADAIEYEKTRWREWFENGDIPEDKYNAQCWKIMEECAINFGMRYFEDEE